MAWLSDITDIKTDAGVCCLRVILDLFARRVYAARLDTQKNADLVCHTFQDAFMVRGTPKIYCSTVTRGDNIRVINFGTFCGTAV